MNEKKIWVLLESYRKIKLNETLRTFYLEKDELGLRFLSNLI